MKRLIPLVAALAVLAVVGGAVALALTNDGPKAFTVEGRSVSQRSVDDELRALAENVALHNAVVQSGAPALSQTRGSILSEVSAGWVGLIVSQEVAAAEVAAQGLHASANDRARGEQLATESVGGADIFTTLPQWFQDRLVARWQRVAVLEDRLIANPTSALQEGVAANCPSGRYVSHILVATLNEATAIKSALDAGGDFAKVAGSSSTDSGSASAGGALGCLDGANFVEPFATAAKTQPIGVVSDPVETEFGFHLLLVTDQPSDADYQQLALEVVLAGSRGVAVDLDPRYGIWDRRTGQVVAPPVRGVATTAPATAPAPAPAPATG